jgi:IS30 family transposase
VAATGIGRSAPTWLPTGERRPKPCKLVLTPRLRAVVEAKLGLCWSPEQIAGWLRVSYPDDSSMRISHETIYLSLYVPHRGRYNATCGAACAPAEPCATRAASAFPRAAAS